MLNLTPKECQQVLNHFVYSDEDSLTDCPTTCEKVDSDCELCSEINCYKAADYDWELVKDKLTVKKGEKKND